MLSFHKHKNTQKTQIQPNFIENIPDTSLLAPKRIFPNNPLGDLMRNVPQGIQYIQRKNYSAKYVLNRTFSKTGKDISTTSKKDVSDEQKFLDILKIYKEKCIPEKQDKDYIVNTKDYIQYLPN
jgi:hypothetical protein